MSGERAQMVFTDLPYNVPIVGNVSGLGKHKHREFAMASGEMTNVEFVGFLRTTFEFLVAYSYDGTIHYVCMDWLEQFERELLVFPNLKHDDQVDALTQLLAWRSRRSTGGFYRHGSIPDIMGPCVDEGDGRDRLSGDGG